MSNVDRKNGSELDNFQNEPIVKILKTIANITGRNVFATRSFIGSVALGGAIVGGVLLVRDFDKNNQKIESAVHPEYPETYEVVSGGEQLTVINASDYQLTYIGEIEAEPPIHIDFFITDLGLDYQKDPTLILNQFPGLKEKFVEINKNSAPIAWRNAGGINLPQPDINFFQDFSPNMQSEKLKHLNYLVNTEIYMQIMELSRQMSNGEPPSPEDYDATYKALERDDIPTIVEITIPYPVNNINK